MNARPKVLVGQLVGVHGIHGPAKLRLERRLDPGPVRGRQSFVVAPLHDDQGTYCDDCDQDKQHSEEDSDGKLPSFTTASRTVG